MTSQAMRSDGWLGSSQDPAACAPTMCTLLQVERSLRPGVVSLLACAGALAAPALAEAAFPGENGPIAFERVMGPSSQQIFVMGPDGGKQDSVTSGIQYSADPAMSPDGTKIAFVRDNDIWVMNADGSKKRVVVDDPGDGQPIDESPSFSPDGKRVVFSRDTNLNVGTQDEILTVNLDTGKLVNLTQNGADLDDQPVYSPDGSKIAWIRNEQAPSPGPDEIFVMDADGGNQQNLSNYGTDASTVWPDYSPDGSSIVFAHDGDIWTMDASDGSDKQIITPGPGPGVSQPVYSPDGSKIAFAQDTGGFSTVDEIVLVGGLNLTNSAQDDFGPSWGPLDAAAPQTRITKKPKRKSRKRKARYRFRSSESGSSFKCRLDKRKWRKCKSPRKYKRLKRGRHRFKVRATDIAGNTDPTPAKHKFKIKKRR